MNAILLLVACECNQSGSVHIDIMFVLLLHCGPLNSEHSHHDFKNGGCQTQLDDEIGSILFLLNTRLSSLTVTQRMDSIVVSYI